VPPDDKLAEMAPQSADLSNDLVDEKGHAAAVCDVDLARRADDSHICRKCGPQVCREAIPEREPKARGKSPHISQSVEFECTEHTTSPLMIHARMRWCKTQALGSGPAHCFRGNRRGSLPDVDVVVPRSSVFLCFFQARRIGIHVQGIERLVAVDVSARSRLLYIPLVFAHQHNDARIVVVA
jgi:hypothetical protein